MDQQNSVTLSTDAIEQVGKSVILSGPKSTYSEYHDHVLEIRKQLRRSSLQNEKLVPHHLTIKSFTNSQPNVATNTSETGEVEYDIKALAQYAPSETSTQSDEDPQDEGSQQFSEDDSDGNEEPPPKLAVHHDNPDLEPKKLSTKPDVVLAKSMFGRHPVVFFSATSFVDPAEDESNKRVNRSHDATECANQSADSNNQLETVQQPRYRLKYRLSWERNCLKDTVHLGGLYRTKGKDWNLLWGKHLTPAKEYSRFLPSQRYNHFPCSGAIGRKDSLGMLIHRYRRDNGNAYHFHPDCFILPGQRESLHRTIKREPRWLWIRKPLASSQGRGIRVLNGEGALKIRKNRKCVVQRYIERPHLINNKKYDIRMYVLVTSYQPLRVYMFPEGLVRFCTLDYSRARSSEKLGNSFGHLTNTSINKHHGEYVGNQSTTADNVGNKWSLSALFHYLDQAHGANTERIRRSLYDIAAKTIIASDSAIGTAVRQHVKSPDTCFELFGFDFILDENFKVWLIEVNISPSMMAPSPLDKKLKSTVVRDALNTVGIPHCNIAKARRKQSKKRREMLHKPASVRRYVQQLKNSSKPVPNRTPRESSKTLALSHRRLSAALPPPGPAHRKTKDTSDQRSVMSSSSTSTRKSSNSTSSGRSVKQKFLKCGKGMRDLARPLSARRTASLSHMDWNELSQEDRDVVLKTYEEGRRSGGFVRLFPPADPRVHSKYMSYFHCQRYENVLVQKFERQVPSLFNL